MAHMFRKYTSNRGSALFMVISTMTALFISCMAMFFSMASARSSQYMVFNQTQANQSATSISRIVHSRISDRNSDLYDKVIALEEGEYLTTDANGFKSLDPGEATGLDDDQIGAYSITITCIWSNEDGTQKEFDIMVISSVDGSRDCVHTTFRYGEDGSLPAVDGDGDAELFAATGYVPNDAYISGGYYLTNVFYDTQYTYMSTYGDSGENRIGMSLSTGGDLMFGGNAMTVVHSASNDAISSADVGKIGPVTWAIRGNFYPNLGSDMGMRGGSQILVGGDLINNSGNNFFYIKNDGYTGSLNLNDYEHSHISIYVNGDFDYSGADLKTNTWVFVNGNVYNVGNNAQPNARIYVTGNAAERAEKTATLSTSTPIYEWPVTGSFGDGLNYTEAMDLLGQKTATIAYYKWDLSSCFTSSEHIDIRLNATNSSWTDKDGNTFGPNQNTFIISYDNNTTSAPLLQQNGGNELGVVGDSFIIDSVQTHTDNNTASQVILIDTGDEEDNVITIKLSDVTGNGEFSWFVDEQYDWMTGTSNFGTLTGMINNNMRLVLVKGRGTVVVDVPNGVTYQDAGYQLSGHIGWWLIEGGKVETKDGHLTFTGVDPQGKYSAKIVPYIHKSCETGDGCHFTEEFVSTKCQLCGGDLLGVSCDVHGNVNKYCPECHPEKADRKDWCENHFHKPAFDTFYSSLSGESKDAVTGADGEIVYPTTNFMLSSCEESAEMRFSMLKNGANITNNTVFGFIYAPYMSYLAAGGAQAGGLLKLCGGMTVGDYDIQAINAYIGCYPDKMPNDLAGMGIGSIKGKIKSSKSWKIEIGGYR